MLFPRKIACIWEVYFLGTALARDRSNNEWEAALVEVRWVRFKEKFNMKKALVCGAGGFIGGHLVKKLKREGYWVRGVDIKEHEFAKTRADEFRLLDLREAHNCWEALNLGPAHPEPDFGELSRAVEGRAGQDGRPTFDEVYQLAADMGGMGFIHTAECDIMRNSALINNHMIDAAAKMGVKRYFFSSSVCVYRDMEPGEPALDESDAYPALPDNEYGWEKLYAERMALAYARHYPIEVRVARFQNCYGPEGTWRGGREKAPAAICRKVAMADPSTSSGQVATIPVWGDGTAVRAYTYVDDLVEGIYMLMQADPARHPELVEGPGGMLAIIGGDEYVTVDELVQTVIAVSGKEIEIEHVEGPVGVQARNFSHARMHELGWEAETSLKEGIATTYAWIEQQVRTLEVA
jgi:nucleoside-diphosphate-sugar epimerase